MFPSDTWNVVDSKIQFLSTQSGLFHLQRIVEHSCKNGAVAEAINFHTIGDCFLYGSVGKHKEYRMQEMCWSGAGREDTEQDAAAGR